MSAAALGRSTLLGTTGDGSGERAALIVAVTAHVALFALLSMAWSTQAPRVWPKPEPIEVSLVQDIAPQAQAPPALTPPAPSVAPDVGVPEEAAPAPPPVAKPEPVKPQPAPQPVKVEPQPKPAKVTPAPAKTEPAPAKLTPKVKPAPAKVPAKPQPTVKPAPAAKPQPAAKSQPAAAAKPAPARPSRLAGLLPSLAAGAKADATAPRPRGRRLGEDLLAGLSADAPAKKPSAAAPGKAWPFPTASIVGAIARQIQPCADRQVNPGPGANQIVTTLDIRLNPDGTLSATPRMVRQAGVGGENERYAQRVVDLGIAAFKGCTPLHLPAEYYRTAAGGWSEINYRWQLR